MDPKITSLPAWEILFGGVKKLDQPVVVLGGGFVAAETTEYICEKGLADDIAIVEMRDAIAFDMEPIFRQMLVEKLRTRGVKMVPHFLITEVSATEVIGQDLRSKRTLKLKAATVVIALGTESVPFPVEAIGKAGIKVLSIGDAKEPRGIAEAVRDGFLAGTSV
jgi:NADPH-dependent 2,4-dienoyl-CoA reductase/sulfur reductase-like enzyme